MMRKFLSLGVLVAVMLISSPAKAVDIGDIYFSDKTFSAELVKGKKPIGMVYWVSPSKAFGLVMQLEQPANKMNYYEANRYCNEYMTEGTKAGDWWLPKRMELMRMGIESINKVSNNKFAVLNAKLPQIKDGNTVLGSPLLANQYYRANSYYGHLFNLSSTTAISTTGTDDSPTNTTKYYVRCVTAF